jgi:hypothetical protein
MKRSLVLVVVALIVAGAAQRALAVIQVNDDLNLQLWGNAPSGQSEGPFDATIYADASRSQTSGSPGQNTWQTSVYGDPKWNLVGPDTTVKSNFLTFCVENNNYFWSSGQTFNIDAIGTETVSGGKYLTGYSAWVYSRFQALGLTPSSTVSGTSPFGTTVPWANAMNDYQEAIWAGMVGAGTSLTNGTESATTTGTRTGAPTDPNAVGGSNSVAGAVYGGAVNLDTPEFENLGISYNAFLTSGWGGSSEAAQLAYLGGYQVLVLYPWAEYGTSYAFGQDQMVFIGQSQGSGQTIPEPTGLAVWGLAALSAAAAGAVRRRGKSARPRWSDENREAIFQVIERKRR